MCALCYNKPEHAIPDRHSCIVAVCLHASQNQPALYDISRGRNHINSHCAVGSNNPYLLYWIFFKCKICVPDMWMNALILSCQIIAYHVITYCIVIDRMFLVNEFTTYIIICRSASDKFGLFGMFSKKAWKLIQFSDVSDSHSNTDYFNSLLWHPSKAGMQYCDLLAIDYFNSRSQCITCRGPIHF